ncbi:MAG: hypothetical protein KDI15_13995, partial [Thiothrix sp.]|nr:hypothetical protein [Thiothrix sp.]
QGYWRIPGVLMGGEALPVEKGIVLEDAVLWGAYRINDQTRVQAALASHDGGVELEQASLGYQTRLAGQPVQMTLGLQAGDFTPSAMTESGSGQLLAGSLLADAFWGRSFLDTGLQLAWEPYEGVTLGAGFWNGDAFPASSGEGAMHVQVQWRRPVAGWSVEAGGWAMQARAEQRGDARYNGDGGHSHAGSSAASPVDVRFDGSTRLGGVWLDVASPVWNDWRAGLQYEAVRVRPDGALSDGSHVADWRADDTGYAITPGIRYGQWRLDYRFERLSLQNHLQGAGAAVLADESALANSRHPKRQSLQLQWKPGRAWTVQAGYTVDQTLSGEHSGRYGLGLVWQDVLYERE